MVIGNRQHILKFAAHSVLLYVYIYIYIIIYINICTLYTFVYIFFLEGGGGVGGGKCWWKKYNRTTTISMFLYIKLAQQSTSTIDIIFNPFIKRDNSLLGNPICKTSNFLWWNRPKDCMNRRTIVFMATYNVTIHSYKTTTYIVIHREIMTLYYNTSLDMYRHSWTYFVMTHPAWCCRKRDISISVLHTIHCTVGASLGSQTYNVTKML